MTVPLWLDGALREHAPLSQDATADVLVVGGGMTSVAAAYHAARLGLRVVLLERGILAAGASGRNAGFLLASPEAYYADAIATHGRDLARDVWLLNRRNRDGVAALVAKLGIACDLEPTGSTVAAVTPRELATLETSARLMSEDGLPHALLDADATAEATAGAGFLGGILIPDDAQLHPAKFVRALAAAAARAGARIHEDSPVVALGREAGAWVARTAAGAEARAPHAICGLNAYTPELVAFARERVFPVRGQVLATAPGAVKLPRPLYADSGYLYVRSYGDRIVAGGMRQLARAEEVGTEDAANASVQTAIEEALARHWPRAAGTAVTHRWSGTMGFSRDARPWIGEVPGSPGLWTSFAYTGHGWGYGPWAGEVLARAVAGERAEIPEWCAIGRALQASRSAV